VKSALFVQSLAKAFKVLEAFGNGDQFLSLSEIAELSNLDKAAAQRCVHTLVETGYLEKEPRTARLMLGKKCLDLTYNLLLTNSLVVAATPILVQLGRDIGERANLSLFDGTSLIYAVRTQSGDDSYFVSALIGRRIPSFCSAGGRATLSRLPVEEVKEILARSNLVRWTRDTAIEPEKILVKIAEARDRGFGTSVGEIMVGEVSVGSAIVDSSGRPIAAVHIAGSLRKWEAGKFEERFGPEAARVAQLLSQYRS
jgi:IclR family pca regulon transcriptional regulator